MSTTNLIHVTPHLTPVSEEGNKLRYRWRAELRCEDGAVHVDGCLGPDAAIGALIREAIMMCVTHDDVIEFVAGLFGDLSVRSADVTLARAVRFASTSPKRRHAGIKVTIEQPPASTLKVPPRQPKQGRGGKQIITLPLRKVQWGAQ